MALKPVMLLLVAVFPTLLATAEPARPYALASRPESTPYLLMPHRADGALPALLSQTGAFRDTPHLTPTDGLIPYDLIVPFWSDGAIKSRWVSVPSGASIKFALVGEWVFPAGTVFVKTFELATDETNPAAKQRLETRLLVCDDTGGVYGALYKWRADNSDADLLATNLTEPVLIHSTTGTRTQMWYYPSRQDCMTCHTPNAGNVLGPKTRQLNRDLTYPTGVTDNQLRTWNHAGLFEPKFDEAALATFPKLIQTSDISHSLEDRARSYLDANCAHCHRPRGTVAYFDARYDTPLARQNLVGGPALIDERIDNARIIAPNDIWRSILFLRANSLEPFKMPPLAHNARDEIGMSVVKQWIQSLHGPPVLPPPEIVPRGGSYDKPVVVTLKTEPGATIRYTLDGTVPTTSDPLYEKPIQVTNPTIVRAKAFKPSFTKSITSQEIFIIGG